MKTALAISQDISLTVWSHLMVDQSPWQIDKMTAVDHIVSSFMNYVATPKSVNVFVNSSYQITSSFVNSVIIFCGQTFMPGKCRTKMKYEQWILLGEIEDIDIYEIYQI